ncbi:glycosyltransferase family 4 protein [Patescibacteria group bacterium]|nr:glycosyltransferase family 4 protein [Patescibacteria group bacterium]MBU1931396.1 glycosyltransferase family 4 protein [Patescibacteria group bacterium]
MVNKFSKLAVVRGQPRMSEAQFYSYFNHFKVKLIGDKTTGWIMENKLPQQVEFINLPLKPVWGFDPWTSFGGPLQTHRSWQFLANLAAYVADCDIINISDLFYFYCWQSAKLAKKLNKKLVTIVWENVLYHPSTYIPPYCFGVRQVLQTTDLFIARSRRTRDYLLSIGADEKKIKVVYKGIDLKVFKPRPKDPVLKRKRPGLEGEKLKILYVGQLVKTKGVLELLVAFERLCSEFDNLELWLLGRSSGEPLEKKVKRLAQRLPIKLKTRVDYDKLPAIYQSADIYCHLSQDWRYLGLLPGGNDWFPYAVIEAMACGLPIVATNVGGIPEQLGRGGNILVKQKDIDSAYKGLKKMIKLGQSRQDIGIQNRRRAEQLFEVEAQARQTEKVILEIL